MKSSPGNKRFYNSRITKVVRSQCLLCVVFREHRALLKSRHEYAAAKQQWPSAKTFGGHKAVDRPDPIPNSAVKRSLADGSGCIASARVGCRQIKKPVPSLVRVFCFLSIVQWCGPDKQKPDCFEVRLSNSRAASL